MTKFGLIAGYALVAASNLAGPKGCWMAADVPKVRTALDNWRHLHGLQHAPLFALGPSSGGWLAGQAARAWPDIRAVAMQVMVPLLDDVRSPAGTRPYPPLHMVLMQRDSSKLKEAAVLLGTEWNGRQHAEMLTASPKPIYPAFFSDGIVGLSPQLSAAVHTALVKSGYVDKGTGMITRHPRRTEWRDSVSSALDATAGERRTLLPQGSLQLAMDAIFARLDMAYAYHASTCQFANETYQHFGRAAAGK